MGNGEYRQFLLPQLNHQTEKRRLSANNHHPPIDSILLVQVILDTRPSLKDIPLELKAFKSWPIGDSKRPSFRKTLQN